VSAPAPSIPDIAGEYAGCARPGGGAGRAWLWIPLAILGGWVAIVVVLWWFVPGPRAWGGPWPWFPFGFFVVVIALVLTVRALGWGRYGGWGARGGWVPPSAREIARSRYARGEITREQYRALLRDLDDGG
jgi:putative membrane protein